MGGCARLSQRPWKILANKMDLPGAAENLAALQLRFPDREVISLSAKEQKGIVSLTRALDRWLREIIPRATAAGLEQPPIKAVGDRIHEYS